MTGLPPYAAFAREFDSLATEGGGNRALSLGLLDIDWFARLNKDRGAAAGDGVLVYLAQELRAQAPEHARVYRYGGDAFAVVMEDTEKEDAFLVMTAVREALSGEVVVNADGNPVELTLGLTAGVATCPDDGGSALEVARKANEAMYRGKVQGGNKVCLAREEKMITKTSHYAQGQLHGLSRLAKREGIGEAVLLREALDDLLRKYNA
jgi:diguanylate cyclase (GGDEF)-like protein